MKFLAALVLGSLVLSIAPSSQAHNNHGTPKSCMAVYQLANELGCEINVSSNNDPNATPKDDNFTVRSTFGPTACKTQELAKELVRDLKTECNNWLKERKADLGTKYQTGTCNEECSDCTMGLKRCSVNGIAHYAK